MDRMTYHGGPGWRCPGCGNINRSTANFCSVCGTPAPPVQVRMEDIDGRDERGLVKEPGRPARGSALKTAAIVLLCLLLAAALGYGASRLILAHTDEPEEPEILEEGGDGQSTDGGSGSTGVTGETPIVISTDGGENTGSSGVDESDAYFVPGNTYTVVAKEGVKVRSGPGKNYGQIARDSLSSYYDQSLKGEKACLKKGTSVECLSMDGDWMEIADGWVCVRADGEDLIK